MDDLEITQVIIFETAERIFEVQLILNNLVLVIIRDFYYFNENKSDYLVLELGEDPRLYTKLVIGFDDGRKKNYEYYMEICRILKSCRDKDSDDYYEYNGDLNIELEYLGD